MAAHGRILALGGEPGIGKTRTARMLASDAMGRNTPVLWGRGLEEPAAPPYWPWLQVFRDWLGTQDDEAQLTATLGDAASFIAGIVPELARRIPDLSPVPPTADASYARFRLFDAIAGFLQRAAAPHGLVVILEDVHWADAPSLRLLEFLAPGVGACRLLLLFTYRDIALSRHHPLSNTLGELARHPAFQRLRLTGLTLPETGKFMTAAAGQRPPAALLAAVHNQTEGNPLFVGEMARFLVRERLIGPQGARLLSGTAGIPGRRIPEGVREVIGRRLNRLSPLCNQVLATAAVVGRSFRIGILSRLIPDGLPSEQLAAALADPAAGRERRRRFVASFLRPHGLETPAAALVADAI
ncbi:MAG: ATP-binding protein, partial [Gammaproteobacteria bacterium]